MSELKCIKLTFNGDSIKLKRIVNSDQVVFSSSYNKGFIPVIIILSIVTGIVLISLLCVIRSRNILKRHVKKLASIIRKLKV